MKKAKTQRNSDSKKDRKIFSSVFKFIRPDSNQIVFFVAAIVIFGAFALSKMTGEKLNARVEIADGVESPENFRKSRIQLNSEEVRLGETDPNVQLTERIREASALSIGLGWFLLSERVSDNPKVTDSVVELMENFSRSPLLPPGMSVLNTAQKTDYGLVQTARGLYFVRYRPRPLMVEILASGKKGGLDGAVFAVRMPDRSAAEFIASQPNASKLKVAGTWASLFVAPENQNAYIPPPFAPGTAYLNTGWKPDVVRANEFSPEKINELQKFLEGVR